MLFVSVFTLLSMSDSGHAFFITKISKKEGNKNDLQQMR